MATSRIQQRSESEVGVLNRGYGVIFLILNIVITGVFWWQLPPQVPLFYSLPYGNLQLADRIWFLLLTGFSVLIYGVAMLLMKMPIKSTLFIPMVGWLETLCLFLIMLSMIHIVMVVL